MGAPRREASARPWRPHAWRELARRPVHRGASCEESAVADGALPIAAVYVGQSPDPVPVRGAEPRHVPRPAQPHPGSALHRDSSRSGVAAASGDHVWAFALVGKPGGPDRQPPAADGGTGDRGGGTRSVWAAGDRRAVLGGGLFRNPPVGGGPGGSRGPPPPHP